MIKEYAKRHKIYQIDVKYFKWPTNIPIFKIPRPFIIHTSKLGFFV
jgi:hypothetical protein